MSGGTDQPTVEAIGETVGEAKWAAMRELERRYPGLDRGAVEFQVLSEGERGLLGVGREPARVIARLTRTPAGGRPAPRPAGAGGAGRDSRGPRSGDRRPGSGGPRRPSTSARAPQLPPLDGPLADRVSELLGTICRGIGVDGSVRMLRGDEGPVAVIDGEELGVLIGKHGHTIDAVQYLVNAIVHEEDEGAGLVTVDAQNYRARRRVALHEQADGAARDALRTGRPVSLEPMSSAERKTVHLHLQERGDVETTSEGREPRRFVVVRPVADAS